MGIIGTFFDGVVYYDNAPTAGEGEVQAQRDRMRALFARTARYPDGGKFDISSSTRTPERQEWCRALLAGEAFNRDQMRKYFQALIAQNTPSTTFERLGMIYQPDLTIWDPAMIAYTQLDRIGKLPKVGLSSDDIDPLPAFPRTLVNLHLGQFDQSAIAYAQKNGLIEPSVRTDVIPAIWAERINVAMTAD